jgi:hypothetical protein
MPVPLKNTKSPAEQPLPFVYDSEPGQELLTGFGGMPLLVQAFRSLGVGASVRRNLEIKQRQRGLDEASYVESFVILNAAGGDCLDDFQRLREDAGLAQMVGHEMPSPEAARKFLYGFHEEDRITQAQQSLAIGQVSYIPAESRPLHGLAEVNRDLVAEVGQRCPDQKIATIDLDATVIESWKKQAQPTYQGGRGYQPMLALWAETNLIVADEFRDGNVPALQAPRPVAARAFAALPETVQEFYFRGDSACYEKDLIGWLRNEDRQGGPKGLIRFGISVRMNPRLKQKMKELPDCLWKPYAEDGEVIKEWVDVTNYWPEAEEVHEGGPLRFVGIRIRRRQGELFPDGGTMKHFAVVTNEWEWSGKKLLEWHREKAGSIEAVHDVLKNELAAGVMPCSRFGANAAWLRLAVITHNVLTALKRIGLPEQMLTARPKRMRFLLFQTPGRILRHARQMVCRLITSAERLELWIQALTLLPLRA